MTPESTRHSLLRRQIKKHFGRIDRVPAEWRAFIDAIDEAYRQSDDDRAMLERSLDLSSRELLQVNSETRAILQAFPDLLFRLDHEGRILDYKAGRSVDLYLSPDEFLGRRIQDLPRDHLRAEFDDAIRSVRDDRSLVCLEYSLTIDGVEQFYEARLLPLLDREIICVIRNITERRRAEDALRDSEAELRDHRARLEDMVRTRTASLTRVNEELRQEIADRKRAESELAAARDQALESVRLKSAFLANMSHEIRTPLNIILGYGDLVCSYLDEAGDSSQTPLVDSIHRAARRLQETIDGILDISKIESGAFAVRPEPLDLIAVVERQLDDFRPLAAERGLVLSHSFAEPRVPIRFDSYCLTHALMNLLQNAIKFTERGGIRIELDRDPQDCLRLGIRDTGIGICPEFLTRLCEPFSQEDSGYSRRFEGSGLGLALTKKYLELNGARLSVESTKGEGSLFRIHFPRSTELATLREVPSEGAARVSRAIERKAAILVVEDDRETQAYMRLLLQRQFDVLSASSADEARRLLAVHDVDIILMDLSLRGNENGLDLTRELRLHERWKSLPIVAVTAHAFEEDRQNALRAGCDDYLSKPVDRNVLSETIARLLSLERNPSRVCEGA